MARKKPARLDSDASSISFGCVARLQSCRLSCGHQTYCCGWQAMSKKPTAKTAFLFLTPTKIHGAFIGNETQKSAVVTVKYAVMRIKKCSIISERCGNIDCANRKGARCRWLKLFPFNFWCNSNVSSEKHVLFRNNKHLCSTPSTISLSPLFLARAVYLWSSWITSSLASSTAPKIPHFLPLLPLTLTAAALPPSLCIRIRWRSNSSNCMPLPWWQSIDRYKCLHSHTYFISLEIFFPLK